MRSEGSGRLVRINCLLGFSSVMTMIMVMVVLPLLLIMTLSTFLMLLFRGTWPAVYGVRLRTYRNCLGWMQDKCEARRTALREQSVLRWCAIPDHSENNHCEIHIRETHFKHLPGIRYPSDGGEHHRRLQQNNKTHALPHHRGGADAEARGKVAVCWWSSAQLVDQQNEIRMNRPRGRTALIQRQIHTKNA